MSSARSMTRTLSSFSRLAPWTGRQLLVEDHQGSAEVVGQHGPSSSTLPSPISVAGLGEATCWVRRPDDRCARGIDQLGEFVEVFLELLCISASLARSGDENRALHGVANVDHVPDEGSSCCLKD